MVAFARGGALLERERELEALRDGVDRACAGEGTLLLIEGPAGAGKTVLAREARAVAERARMMPLEASGSELEQSFAFGVVRQLLEPVISKDPGQADLFAGAAGPAARLFEPGERRPLDAAAGFAALHSLYWLVVNIADQAPVLVLVDDCQWADRDSLRFLAYLAQRIEGLPVTILLTGRPPDAGGDEAGALWVQLASRPAAAALYPRPLSESAAVTMTREHLGADAAEEFCRACHTATGGNPLFLRELLRALAAAEVVPSAAAASAIQDVGPSVVSRFVLHRLAALGPAATELARAVAVLGDDSEPLLAGRMSGLSQDDAREAADDLVRADIFLPAERLGFVHPIVRAALYEDLAPGERQARHAAAAEALAREGASAERVTAHLLLTPPTGDQRRAGTLRSAAAATYLRRALAEQERGEILADLGRSEVATMQFEAAEKHLRAALASGATLATRADAASWLGRCATVSGGPAEQPERQSARVYGAVDSRLQRADGPGHRPAAERLHVREPEERFHLLTTGTGFGNPSTCANEGRQWNSPSDNAEWGDGGPTPVTCQTAASPSNNINLSFACNPSTSGGDSNCTHQVASTGCAGGPCLIGANPVGWETLHADYWQTWQEGRGDVSGNGTDVSNPPDPTQGSFRDLIEDCSNEVAPGSPTACSFINNTTGQTPGNILIFYTTTENS